MTPLFVPASALGSGRLAAAVPRQRAREADQSRGRVRFGDRPGGRVQRCCGVGKEPSRLAEARRARGRIGCAGPEPEARTSAGTAARGRPEQRSAAAQGRLRESRRPLIRTDRSY